ncbi:hypothetical protein B0H66DRAFT_457037, partial [Apodospora peruviana]
LPRFALPIALLVGCAITGGTTYALVAWVLNLIANASVDSDAGKWKAAARTEVYDACYFGCNDCDDPSYAFNACQRTAAVSVKSAVICDGTRMWNWAEADRYPDACLETVGKVLMGDALEALKKSYRNRLAIIILTVLAGVVGGAVTFFVWRRYSMSKAAREARKAGRDENGPPRRARTWWPNTWRKEQKPPHHASAFGGGGDTVHNTDSRRSSSSSSSSHSSTRGSRGGGGNGNGLRLFAALVGLFSSSKTHASAYPCTGHGDMPWNQFFTATLPASNSSSTGLTISGVVHGWISNCYDRDDCHQVCSTSCSTDSSTGKQTCSNKCKNNCVRRTYTDRSPRDYVEVVVPRVKACGFRVVDALIDMPGGELTRVGNPLIEKDYWVRISVAPGFNVSRADETDEMVWCLHGIGG